MTAGAERRARILSAAQAICRQPGLVVILPAGGWNRALYWFVLVAWASTHKVDRFSGPLRTPDEPWHFEYLGSGESLAMQAGTHPLADQGRFRFPLP